MPTLDEVPVSHHVYLSTACLHGNHGYCSQSVRDDGGVKVPGRCKFCPSRCVCDCHLADEVSVSPVTSP